MATHLILESSKMFPTIDQDGVLLESMWVAALSGFPIRTRWGVLSCLGLGRLQKGILRKVLTKPGSSGRRLPRPNFSKHLYAHICLGRKDQRSRCHLLLSVWEQGLDRSGPTSEGTSFDPSAQWNLAERRWKSRFLINKGWADSKCQENIFTVPNDFNSLDHFFALGICPHRQNSFCNLNGKYSSTFLDPWELLGFRNLVCKPMCWNIYRLSLTVHWWCVR